MTSGPIVPPWIVLPLMIAAMVPVAAYILALRELPPDAMPRVRRRVRLAGAWVGLVTMAAVGAGLGLVRVSDAVLFVVVWTTAGALLVLAVLLAIADMLVTAREVRRLARAKAEALREARRLIEAAASGRIAVERDGVEHDRGDPPEPLPFPGMERTDRRPGDDG